MIYITLGTQNNDFSRCLKEFEKIVAEMGIEEEVIAQIGYTHYKPKRFTCLNFVSEDDYQRYIAEARVVISHAGSGALFSSIKKNKKVIAVARLAKYGEMLNDHQTELVKKLSEEGYLLDGTYDMRTAWQQIDTFVPSNKPIQCTIQNEIKKKLNDWGIIFVGDDKSRTLR